MRDRDRRPRLNPLRDDLFARALEDAGLLDALEAAGYPRAAIDALREYGDPRPRLELPDGTTVVAEYVPPLPAWSDEKWRSWERKARDAFVRLCAEQIGLPIHPARRGAFLAELAQLQLDPPDGVRAAWCDPEAGEALAGALADPPDPDDVDAWNEWAERAWRAACAGLGDSLWREVMGGDARRGEGKEHVGLDADEAPPLPDPGDRTRYDVDAMLEDAEEARLRAVADLTPAEERVWVLYYHRDLAPAEIAERTGRAPPTVRVLLHRARKKMQAAYAS